MCGPYTKEEKVQWDKLIARRAEAQAEVCEYAGRYRRAREPKQKEIILSLWHGEQRIFDVINDNQPLRYQTQLKDRSLQDGASRSGDQKSGSWPGE